MPPPILVQHPYPLTPFTDTSLPSRPSFLIKVLNPPPSPAFPLLPPPTARARALRHVGFQFVQKGGEHAIDVERGIAEEDAPKLLQDITRAAPP